MDGGYEHDTYAAYRTGSERSAAIVAQLVTELLQPRSVLDVGCGTGGWLEAFRAEGVEELHGIDGPWSPAGEMLRPGEFTCWNFEEDAPSGPALPCQRYDLLISMEFVEHISQTRADDLAAFLAAHGDVLLVSTAIPLQGGQHHVNERWPEYWGRKFAAHGYRPYDALRLALWDEPGVESWYRQNMILYFRDGNVPTAIREWGERLALAVLETPRALVHPEFYGRSFGRLQYALRRPMSFAQMLWRERKSRTRAIPRMGNLQRED